MHYSPPAQSEVLSYFWENIGGKLGFYITLYFQVNYGMGTLQHNVGRNDQKESLFFGSQLGGKAPSGNMLMFT